MPQTKPCATPRCGQLVPLGTTHCPTHTRANNQRRHRKATTNGLHSNRWRTLRAQALHRDGGRCQHCHQAPATTCHLHPDLHGNHLSATLDDVVSLCASCHGTLDAPRALGGRGTPLDRARSPRASRFLTET
jgi:5-methylcytosine-specific restriction endonuclease McrA